jgi:hypothetical protein
MSELDQQRGNVIPIRPGVRLPAQRFQPPVSGEEFAKRNASGTPLVYLPLASSALQGLYRANLVTVEEVAGRSAQEVRAIHGVGSSTMDKLERALTEHGLTFREDREAVR